MPIDSNIQERDIRVFATGTKSWLFSDTADGAKAGAVIYSLMLSGGSHGVPALSAQRNRAYDNYRDVWREYLPSDMDRRRFTALVPNVNR